MHRHPAAGLIEEPERLRALEPVDVDDLVAVEEREIGVASIAAPIRDTSSRVVAAISIGGPAARMGAQQRRRLAEVVVEAGEAASRRLGWSPETQHLREG